MSDITKKDLQDQQLFIVEAFQTMTAKVTSDIKDDIAILYADTQKRLIQLEESTRKSLQDHEERISYLEKRDIEYTWWQRHGVKLVAGLTLLFFILLILI